MYRRLTTSYFSENETVVEAEKSEHHYILIAIHYFYHFLGKIWFLSKKNNNN